MPIVCDQDNRVITLHTDNTTYQMKVDRLGYLLHLYYGRRSYGVMDYLPSLFDRGTSPVSYELNDDRTYSLDFLPQEFLKVESLKRIL